MNTLESNTVKKEEESNTVEKNQFLLEELKQLSTEDVLPPPDGLMDEFPIVPSNSVKQSVNSVVLGPSKEKTTFANAVGGTVPKVPKVPKEAAAQGQRVLPIKTIPSKISIPLPTPVIPYNYPVDWCPPRFRVRKSENGEIFQYQMEVGDMVYNLEPIYFYETTNPIDLSLNLKARGCYRCFSLLHNKRMHEQELDPSLSVLVRVFVCYVCGRLGYNSDNCVSPKCAQNKLRPKVFRKDVVYR